MSPIYFTIFLPPDGGKGKENNGSVNECDGWQSMVKGVVVNGPKKEFLS